MESSLGTNQTLRTMVGPGAGPQPSSAASGPSSPAPAPVSHATLGRVVSVGGAQATVALSSGASGLPDKAQPKVGKFLGIASGKNTIIGVITELTEQTAREQTHGILARLDMVGEIRTNANGAPVFGRGVTEYPSIGDPCAMLSDRELRLVYGATGIDTAHIGTLQQDDSVQVHLNIDDLLSKHFAVLGTTGVGKSSGVAIILQQILNVRPNLRIFLVDPHNEYARCFGDKAQVLTPRNLRLPFWLFNFEEIVDAFFGGRPGVEEEVEILSEVIPLAKSAYLQYRNNSNERQLVKKRDAKNSGFTADTPVPYRIEDLISLLDERMGKLENRTSRMTYHRLIGRIQTFRNHPRYAFMFENANIGGDTMVELLAHLFRLPPDGKPMTIMQMAGFPAEVIDSVVSVLCRMAFDFGLWSEGIAPLLFVCEEAHRYAPANSKIGFGPTRRALSRIAKEGRKYGVFLGLVTQRPAEIDPTIISQCSTLFAMRMSNDRDQALIRSAVSDAAANLLSFIPSLGTREVFAFGPAVAAPTRLTFKELPASLRPSSEAAGNTRSDSQGNISKTVLDAVIERWRMSTMSHRGSLDDDVFDQPLPMHDQVPLQPAPPVPSGPVPLPPNPLSNPARFQSLRKPADAGAQSSPAPLNPPLRRF